MTETSIVKPENWLNDYGDMLYRYAFSRVQSEVQAEDLLQETLLAGITGLEKFNGKSTVSSWLVGILKHKIMDFYRKSQRETLLLTKDDLGEDLMNHQFDAQGHWNIKLADWVTPEKALDNEAFWQTFYGCQSRLSNRMERLFTLRVIEGLSTEECCQLLGFKNDNQLWVALSRTRMKLRQCLEAHWFN